MGELERSGSVIRSAGLSPELLSSSGSGCLPTCFDCSAKRAQLTTLSFTFSSPTLHFAAGPNSTQTPGGLKGAPGEIREQQLEELPDGALYVGRTSHMTLDDVREYSKLQPTVYKLHQNDCRWEEAG